MTKHFPYFILLFITASFLTSAQTPNVQDCGGATPLCQTTYTEANAYTGTGNIPNEIDTNTSCLTTGERNDVWYTFAVQSSGNLCFTITPNVAADDYDWAVFNVSSASCQDINNNPSLETSCNYAPNPGPTGPNGLGGPQNNLCIPVSSGERYVINVSQFSVSLNGYGIDFTASTASIVDNTSPTLASLDTPYSCGVTTMNLSFSEEILCTSVQSSDFQVTGPGGSYTVTNVAGSACIGGDQLEQNFTVTVSPPLLYDGTYNFCLSASSGSVSDLCSHLAGASCISFSITGVESAITSTTHVTCFNGSNGSSTVTPSTGSAPYSYQWNTLPNQSGSTATGLRAGVYSVTVTDAIGCAGTASVTITAPVVIPDDFDVSCDSSSCDGSASVLPMGGTPPFSYQWLDEDYNPIPGETTSSTNNLCAGTFCVVTNDSNSCADTTCISIQLPSTSLSQVSPSCPGDCDGSAKMVETGGVPPLTFQWESSPGNPIAGETDSMLSNLCTGRYYIKISDSIGCVLEDSIDVVNLAPLTITMVAKNTCAGMCNGQVAAVVTGGTSPFTYQWDDINNSTASLILNLCPDTFNVTVTDSKSCDTTSTAVIIESAPMTLNPSSVNTSCSQPDGVVTVVASGGSSPYTYRWDDDNNSVTQSVTALPAGAYSVVVTDNIGCKDTAYAFIGYTDSNIATISVIQPISCPGVCDGQVQVTIAGGSPPYTFSWTTKATTSNIDSACADSVGVTATDSTGCPAAATIILQEPPPISIDFITPTPETTCNSGDGSVDITVSGGNPPYTYLWTTTATTEDISGLAAGTYGVTVDDSKNCKHDSDQTTLTQPPPIIVSVVNIIPETTCNSSDGSIDIQISEGKAPYTYIWSTGATTEDVSGLTTGTYSVTVTDINNCPSDSESATLTQPPPVIATVISIVPETSCQSSDGSIDIQVTNGEAPYTYTWSDPNSQSTASATGLTAGTYTVTVTDINNCPPDTSSATLPPPPPIVFDITPEDLSCPNSNDGKATVSVASGGESPFTYLWSNGQTGNADVTSGLATGSYSVSVTDINQCPPVAFPFEISEPTPLTSSTKAICEDTKGSVDLSVSGGTPPYQFSWSNGMTSEDITGAELSSYSVTVTDANGCKDTSDAELSRELCTIFVPTVFTPNENGTNDVWDIENLSVYPDAKVKVFNRWGDIVFRSEGYEKPWEGTYLMIKLPTAAYYYIITVESIDKVLTGTVTIMK